MKCLLVILIVVWLIMSVNAHAVNDSDVSPNISQLAVTICAIYSRDARKVATSAEAAIIRHMKRHEKISNPTPEQMIRFLNRNKNHMLCGDTNYMVESFRHGAYDELFNILFYEKLLVEDEDLYVDINAISYTGGQHPTDRNKHNQEPETVLDYMYREVNREARGEKARGEIQYLIEMFEEYFNGKRYSELTDAEKATAARYIN
ncbi:MAG: hypothetical protein ABNH21_16515 [Glaciecola sp.]